MAGWLVGWLVGLLRTVFDKAPRGNADESVCLAKIDNSVLVRRRVGVGVAILDSTFLVKIRERERERERERDFANVEVSTNTHTIESTWPFGTHRL